MCIKSPSAVWKCLSMIWKADLWFWKISFQIRGTLADNHSVHCAGYPKMVCSTEGRTTSGQNLVGRMVSSRGQKLENLKRSFQLEIRSRGLWPIIKIQGPLQLEKELQGQQTKKKCFSFERCVTLACEKCQIVPLREFWMHSKCFCFFVPKVSRI